MCVCLRRWRETRNFDIHPFAWTSSGTDDNYGRSHTLMIFNQTFSGTWKLVTWVGFGMLMAKPKVIIHQGNQYSRLSNFEPPGPQAANQRLIEQLARTSELWSVLGLAFQMWHQSPMSSKLPSEKNLHDFLLSSESLMVALKVMRSGPTPLWEAASKVELGIQRI